MKVLGLYSSSPFLSLLVLICFSCVPLNQTTTATSSSSKVLLHEDKVYEDGIKTVLLYPFQGNIEDEVKPAVIPINQEAPLLLSFDQLSSDYGTFKARIVHCNKDWEKSSLSENEYLFTFNEFPLTDYEFSFNTRTQYTHYRFTVPKVKIPGNYLVVVYQNNNRNDIILSKRFMVFSQLVSITHEVRPSSDISMRNKNQQIEFAINYGNLEILNPLEDVKVVIRQNERWDNAITHLKPSFARVGEGILEYEYFDLSNNFFGGNEFRFFDLRAINYSGQNISGIEKKADRLDAFIMRDEERGTEAYALYNDINGDFVINNLESSPARIASDYVHVHFFLEKEEKLDQEVHIAGELTNWNYSPESQMRYDEELKGYTNTLLLKQGWYNYVYYMPNLEANPYLIEGSHYETENLYEFIVYFRAPGSRADQIIGYKKFNYNKRTN